MAPRANLSHYPERYLDWFSRFVYILNAMMYNALSVGKKNPRNCPFPLGFRLPVGGGPSHNNRQHAQKFGKDRSCGSGDMLADRQTHRHTDGQTYLLQYFATSHAGEVITNGDNRRQPNRRTTQGRCCHVGSEFVNKWRYIEKMETNSGITDETFIRSVN